jgi:dTDP-4-amino-4,6-dideoxygalactose transaminase
MEYAEEITRRRVDLWEVYHRGFAGAESAGKLRRPSVPAHCTHNAHMYYLLLPDISQRTRFIEKLRADDIHCVFHYVPLHSAPAGCRLGRVHGDLTNTTTLSERLVRMPLWLGLEEHQQRVIEKALAALD